jgi:ABC-type bacteriocin/lantibiotic exporter with double-glycine peptidase domain
MRKKLRFYKQHSMETCGPACILMLLDLYGKIEYPTPKQEMKLYSLYRSRAFRGVNGAAIANCLSRNSLTVHLIHSSEDMMDNRDGYFPEELFNELLAEYRTEIEKYSDRVSIVSGAEISCDTLRQELDAGRLIILETIIPGDADGMHDHVLHWVVVYGYEDDLFYVCDPLSSKIKLTADELEEYMDTPIGRICITVSDENTNNVGGEKLGYVKKG